MYNFKDEFDGLYEYFIEFDRSDNIHAQLTKCIFEVDDLNELKQRLAYSETCITSLHIETVIECFLLHGSEDIAECILDRYYLILVSNPECMKEQFREYYMYDDYLRRTTIPRYILFLNKRPQEEWMKYLPEYFVISRDNIIMCEKSM